MPPPPVIDDTHPAPLHDLEDRVERMGQAAELQEDRVSNEFDALERRLSALEDDTRTVARAATTAAADLRNLAHGRNSISDAIVALEAELQRPPPLPVAPVLPRTTTHVAEAPAASRRRARSPSLVSSDDEFVPSMPAVAPTPARARAPNAAPRGGGRRRDNRTPNKRQRTAATPGSSQGGASTSMAPRGNRSGLVTVRFGSIPWSSNAATLRQEVLAIARPAWDLMPSEKPPRASTRRYAEICEVQSASAQKRGNTRWRPITRHTSSFSSLMSLPDMLQAPAELGFVLELVVAPPPSKPRSDIRNAPSAAHDRPTVSPCKDRRGPHHTARLITSVKTSSTGTRHLVCQPPPSPPPSPSVPPSLPPSRDQSPRYVADM